MCILPKSTIAFIHGFIRDGNQNNKLTRQNATISAVFGFFVLLKILDFLYQQVIRDSSQLEIIERVSHDINFEFYNLHAWNLST